MPREPTSPDARVGRPGEADKSTASVAPEAARHGLEGPVTILFTDVVGSTDLRTRRGDQAARQLLRAHEDVIRTQVDSHDGREVKALGDGFMVAFASARRALACAVAIQRAIEARHLELPEVRVRIGLNTGEAVWEEGDLYGQAVHAAARIAAKAGAGEILVSEVLKQLVGTSPEFHFRERGRYRLKGFPERWRLFEVLWREEEGPASILAERTPYVGRESERAELARLLASALQGRGALVMIAGEPGVGKTRLTEEVAAEAARRGMGVRIGRCYEAEGAPPYIPFIEMLEQALTQAPSPAAFRELLGDDAPEVAKLLPRLRRLFPDIPPSLELPPEQGRRYLFNSLGDYLGRASAERPLFLVLDDLHWADEPTLLLLEHLAERLAEIPVLAVGTYRDTEVTEGHPLSPTLDRLVRRRLVHRVGLRRLPEAGVAGMLRALSSQEPPLTLVKLIHGETDGNPFFIEEVFQHLAEEGRLFGADGRFRRELLISELDVPESVRIVVGRRLERLTEDARRALAAAAVVGRAFTFELLEAMGDLGSEALLDALDQGERARLVLPLSEEASETRLLFAHELIRQTLLSELSQPRRRRLHLRAAKAIERLYADSLEDHASEIAHHLAQAGPAADAEKLLRYLTLAGRQAMAASGFEEALRHFEYAFSLRELADAVQLADLLVDLARARRSLGRWEEALATWQEAVEARQALEEGGGVAEVCYEASQDLWWINRDEEAFAMAQRGLLALGEDAGPQRAQMLAWAGAAGAFITPYDVGADMIDEALVLAEQLGDTRLLGHTLAAKAVHLFPFYHHGELVEAGLEGATLLRSAGDLWEATWALSLAELGLVVLGRMEHAREVGAEVAPLIDRLGHYGALFLHVRAQGPREFIAGADLDRYEAFARQDLELAQEMEQQAVSFAWLGLVQFLRGNWDAALQLTKEGTQHEPPNALNGFAWGPFFQTLAYQGEQAEALAVLDRTHDQLPGRGRANGFGSWNHLMSVIEGLYVIGEREEAATLYPQARAFLTTGVVIDLFQCRLVERVAGIAAAAGRQWDAAEAHFLTALRQAEGLSHRLELAETRRFYAQMLLDRAAPGDRDQARSFLNEAIEEYHRIGIPRHEDIARAVLAQVP